MSKTKMYADHAINTLSEEFNLMVISDGEDEFKETIERLFNGNNSNRPRAIVRPRDSAEVSHVLKVVALNHGKVSVLGGGHDPKGLSVIRDGLVLDMSAMKNIDIDAEAATAWVEAGVTVQQLDDVTCPLSLAAVNGSCSDVGVIGLILGGGFGFLSRTQGMAVDNCLQMEIVTVNGQRIVTSSQQHVQLFWALRGAGHVGFGVVTKAQIKLHTLQDKYIGGRLCYLPMSSSRLKTFLEDMNAFCKEAEDEITFNIYLITNIPGVAVDYFYDGPPEEAERNLLPFLRGLTEKFGPPGGHSSVDGSFREETTSYVKYQQRFGVEPEKTRKLWKSAFLDDLTPEVIQVIMDSLESAPVTSNHHTIGLELLGGEINRKSRDSCAYAHRDALYLFSVQAMWKPEDEAGGMAHACRQWAELTAQSLLPYSLGSYQNYADCGEKSANQRLKNYFSEDNIHQLRELKRKFDPQGVLSKEHFGL